VAGAFTPDEWRTVLPLSFAAFFENYDYALLSVAAPVLSRGLGVSPEDFGVAVSVVRVAGLAAVLLVGLADRVGRRTMLLVTLAGLALFTGLTAVAWSVASFVVLSSLSRVFLSAEGVMTGVVIAEEVHPARRGRAISVTGFIGQTAFGAVAILITVVPHLPLGWRWLYLFALGPLLLVLVLRRNLSETRAFAVASTSDRVSSRLPRIERRWWGPTAACTLVFGLVGAYQTTAAYDAAQLAQDTYGWTGRFTVIVMVSGVFTLVGFLLGGRGSDRVGRRPILSCGVVVGAAGGALMFHGGEGWFAPGWFAFVVGQAMIAGCWLAFVSELVPTEVRATVTSVVVSLQVAAGSVGLAVASLVGESPRSSGQVAVVIGVVAVAGLAVLWRLPEVAGRDVVEAYGTR